MKCCICGEECENEWGNNPWPVNKHEDARCCNECDNMYVIPARIRLMIEQRTKEEQKEE